MLEMEGLIPMVFKAFKKNRTRSQYKCLSTSNSTPPPQSYDLSHFNPQGYTYHYATLTPPPHPAGGRVNGQHRRTMSSMGDYSTGFSAPEPEEHRLKSRQLLRLGSHGFLSCVK